MNWSLWKKSLVISIVLFAGLVIFALVIYSRKYGFFNDAYVPDDPANIVVVSTSSASTQSVTNVVLENSSATTTDESGGVVKKDVVLIDGSGQRDLNERVKGLLIANNFPTTDGEKTDVVYSDMAVVIKFSPGQLKLAQEIDELLNKQAELRQEETKNGQVEVILGSKFK